MDEETKEALADLHARCDEIQLIAASAAAECFTFRCVCAVLMLEIARLKGGDVSRNVSVMEAAMLGTIDGLDLAPEPEAIAMKVIPQVAGLALTAAENPGQPPSSEA